MFQRIFRLGRDRQQQDNHHQLQQQTSSSSSPLLKHQEGFDNILSPVGANRRFRNQVPYNSLTGIRQSSSTASLPTAPASVTMNGNHSSTENSKSNGPNGTAARYRQQYAQQQQQHTQQLYPYRDDPDAPPSVRLESFTRGGVGPLPIHPPLGIDERLNPNKDNTTKSKDLSWSRRIWTKCQRSLRACCSDACGSSTCCTMGRPSQYSNDLYYQDHFNDLSWSCSMGTSDDDGIWLNQNDPAGTIMAILVWVLILYSVFTISFLAQTSGIPVYLSYLYTVLASLGLSCHAKTTLTDPGSVPQCAVPTEAQRNTQPRLSMCSQCQTFKPPMSHHCRICNRCISRMDHHCPWMNNCIGAGNMKHFLLFLAYTWTCSVFLLLLLGWNYFFCASEECVFNIVLTQLVRIMTVLSIGCFLFTSSMLMNVVYGIMTGIGTIDRLKKKAQGLVHDSDDEAIPLTDIFGIGPFYTWCIPVDPVFPDYDRVMGYSTPQRLLREQMMRSSDRDTTIVNGGSVVNGIGGVGGAPSTVVSSYVGGGPVHYRMPPV